MCDIVLNCILYFFIIIKTGRYSIEFILCPI